jgi:peptide/nickel transport system ATP-binding protein
MSRPVLRVEGLSVTYTVGGGSFEALHDIGFELRRGEVLGVVGESGCGKSTLSSAILQLLPPNGRVSGGRINLEGDDLTQLRGEALRAVRGRRIGMVFQDPMTSLNPTFRVATQMINAQKAHGIGGDQEERWERAVALLDRVGIPDARHRIDEYPHHFSGGMRQRMMIATALLLEPQVLICDEATSALDVTLQAQVLELLRELCQERDTAIIFISHDLGVVSEICEQLMVLYAGRAIEAGSLAQVLERPEHPYTRRLLAAVPSRHRRSERLATIRGRVPSLAALPPGCTFANRCDYRQDVCEAGEPALLEHGSRRVRCLIHAPESDYDQGKAQEIAAAVEADVAAPAGPPLEADELLRLDELRTHFPERRSVVDILARRPVEAVRAVDGVDLTLRAGEAVGLVGESGSGKTTLGKALLDLVPITSGGAHFDGVALHELSGSGWRPLRQRLQMIFQEPAGSLSPRLRVAQLITEPYRINDVPPEERDDVDALLETVGLSAEQATKYPHQLSGGQARRVGIARALAVRPDFLVADEPTAGLDVSAAASVLNLLQDLRRERGLSYLIITHDLNLVGYVADRIAVMYLGRVVELGTADQIFEQAGHPYTHALLASIPEPTPGRSIAVGSRVTGEIPSPRHPPSGCRFRTRCPFAEDRCADEVPPLYPGAEGHGIACHFWEDIAAGRKRRTGPHDAEVAQTPG